MWLRQAQASDVAVVVTGAEQSHQDGKQGFGARRILADAVAVLDEVLDTGRDAQAAQVQVAVGRRREPGRRWCRRTFRFGEVAEVGGVVAEVIGIAHHDFTGLPGLEVAGAWNAQDAGEVGGAVHVPALVMAGVLKEPLPAAAHAPEGISFGLRGQAGDFLEQPVDLESVPGVHDEGRLVRGCVKQGQRRVLGRWQGVLGLVGAGAVVVEVEPQAGDADDVIGLAARTVIGGAVATDSQADIAVLVKVEFGDRHGDGKPNSLSAWGVEDSEPAGFCVTV